GCGRGPMRAMPPPITNSLRSATWAASASRRVTRTSGWSSSSLTRPMLGDRRRSPDRRRPGLGVRPPGRGWIMGWLDERRRQYESGEREFITDRAAKIWELSYLVPAVVILVVVVAVLAISAFD